MAVSTKGIRHESADFWDLSGVLRNSEAAHYPFIVMRQTGDDVEVTTVKNVVDLLQHPDETAVLWQWRGQYRSDFFAFTVGQFREHWTAVRDAIRNESRP